MPESVHSGYRILWITVLAALAVRLAMATSLNLFQDEALYAFIAFHDPFSFCPHPPGTGLAVLAGTAIAGHRELGVRLVSIIVSSLTLVVIFLAARRRNSTRPRAVPSP